MPEPVSTATGVMALINALLALSKEILEKFPDYPEKVKAELHELEGEYFALKTMKRTDARFSTERLIKTKARYESFAITVASELEKRKQGA